jgi:uncharacterized protein (TIGR02001 family)
MKIPKKFFLTTIFIVFSMFSTSFILEAGTSYQLTLTSRYIWRGFDMNPPNKLAFQPSITHDFGDSGFSLNLWGSFSFENKQANEADATLSYRFKTPEKYSLSVGFTHYGWYFAKNFSFKKNTTQEAYISVGLPKMYLNPTLTFYYDFNNGDGYYALLGVGHSVKVSGEINANVSASLGYNGKQWIDKSGFSDLNLGVTVPLKIDKITVSPFLNVVFILLDAVNPGVNHETVFGVSVAF